MSTARPTVCAIIPAFNEEARVAAVVRMAQASGLFSEIVVVDDGSSDGTARAAEQAGARVLRHAENRGKAAGLHTGLAATNCPVVCFLDADLLKITPEHLCALCDPVLDGKAKSMLAKFTGGRPATTLAQSIAPFITGQRCLRRELLDGFTEWNCRYGIETALNAHLARLGVEQTIVPWHGAAQVMKEEKRGLISGFRSRLGMYSDIMRTWAKSRR